MVLLGALVLSHEFPLLHRTIAQTAKQRPRFTDIASRSAFSYTSNNGFTGRKYFPQPMCGGVAILDYDKDGLMDIYFTNGARLPELKKTESSFYNALLRNKGGGICVKEMAAYIARHPEDAVGHYNLAQFSWRTDPEKSLAQLATALRLDPKFAPAHVSRAWLVHRLGRSSEAVPHLEAALEVKPGDVRALDQLGVVYLALDQLESAEKVLRRAAVIAPDDPQVLVHLGRALMALGHDNEAQQFLEKYQRLGPLRSRDPHKEPGMIESATLSAAERRAREIERFRVMARSRPDDPVLQLNLASLLLADGRLDDWPNSVYCSH